MMYKISKFLFCAGIALISSCKPVSVVTMDRDTFNPHACENPVYVATMAVSAKVMAPGTDGQVALTYNQMRMTLVALLNEAQTKFGQDVTIQNIRWDMKDSKKKTGAIFDVVKCK